MVAIMDRASLGATNVAEPLTEAFDNLCAAVQRKGWADFHRQPVFYYYDRMMGNWLLQLIDNALSDAQLAAVRPAEVHRIVLLLIRDMFRHHSGLLRPAAFDGAWVEQLFQEIATGLHLPADAIKDDGTPYGLGDLQNCRWANDLAEPLGLPAEKLFVCHVAIVTGITEELGSGEPKESTELPSKRPWWKFW
jgi:hypothetical protein